jgi:hypothetical protein
MRVRREGRGLALAGLVCLMVACTKSPEQVEAERARAHAAWLADSERAERARQAEEKRLVDAALAAHRQEVQADDERAVHAAEDRAKAEQDRLLEMVRAKLRNPEEATFSGVHWNAARSAICGELTERDERDERGAYATPLAFFASSDRVAVDSEAADEHGSFSAAARAADCSP